MLSEFLTLPFSDECSELSLSEAYSLNCLIYRPMVERRSDRVLVAVHGISRNYRIQAAAFRSMAERLGICLMAPLFDKERFPNYQRLAANTRQLRADQSLSMLLLTWQAARMLPGLKMHLIGYSGGAQFAHRYAYLYPQRVASLSICSAGWYTLPSPDINYPYGLKNWPEWLGKPQPDELAKLPMQVMVGERDDLRDASLRQNRRLDQWQGRDRIERAGSWVEYINRKRLELGYPVLAPPTVMKEQGHDFEDSVEKGLIVPPIERFIRNLGG